MPIDAAGNRSSSGVRSIMVEHVVIPAVARAGRAVEDPQRNRAQGAVSTRRTTSGAPRHTGGHVRLRRSKRTDAVVADSVRPETVARAATSNDIGDAGVVAEPLPPIRWRAPEPEAPRLGEFLVERGMITGQQFDRPLDDGFEDDGIGADRLPTARFGALHAPEIKVLFPAISTGGESVNRPERRWARRNASAAIAGLASNVGAAVLSALALVILARLDRIAEVGAYTAGTVSLSFVAVLASFGTGLRALAEDPASFEASRRWRLGIVTPALVLGSVIAAAVYGQLGFSSPQVLFAGLALAVNGLVEIQVVALQRRIRYGPALWSTVLTKALSVGIILLDVNLALAVLVASLVQLAWLEISTRPEHLFRRFRLSRELARQVTRNRGTHFGSLSIAQFAGNRFDGLVVSLSYSPTTTGAYGAVYSLFQAGLASLYSVAQATLPLRRVARDSQFSERPTQRLAKVTVWAAGLGSVVLFLAASVISRTLFESGQAPAATTWLRILALAVVPFIYSRLVVFDFLSHGKSAVAARIVIPPVVVASLAMIVCIPLLGVVWGPILTLAQEVAAAALAWHASRRARASGAAPVPAEDRPTAMG